MRDLVSQIMAYESGELTEAEVVDLFQRLIDNGMAWTMQGSYGRTAQALIESGDCTYGDEAMQSDSELPDDADPGDMDGDAQSALASAGWGTDEDYGGGYDREDFHTDEGLSSFDNDSRYND